MTPFVNQKSLNHLLLFAQLAVVELCIVVYDRVVVNLGHRVLEQIERMRHIVAHKRVVDERYRFCFVCLIIFVFD